MHLGTCQDGMPAARVYGETPKSTPEADSDDVSWCTDRMTATKTSCPMKRNSPIMSTPSSRFGVGSLEHNCMDVSKLDRYLLHDIQAMSECSVVDMIKECLRRCLPVPQDESANMTRILNECLDKMLPWCSIDYAHRNDPTTSESDAAERQTTAQYIRAELRDYCNPSTEKKRLKSLARLFNKILEVTKNMDLPLRPTNKELDIMFHVNNPLDTYFAPKGSQALRPDGVFVSFSDVQDRSNGPIRSWSDHAFDTATRRPVIPFSWQNIFCSVDVRLVQEHLEIYHSLYTEKPPQTIPCIPAPTRISEDLKRYLSAVALERRDEYPNRSSASLSGLKRKTYSGREPRLERSKRIRSDPGPTAMPSIALADMHVAKDHTEKKLHVTTQIASYATEMLANSSQRLHAINLTVIDDVLHIWWFDRENVLQSRGLNFVVDLPYVMVLLAAFQRFKKLDWGRGHIFTRLPRDPISHTKIEVMDHFGPGASKRTFCFGRDGEPELLDASKLLNASPKTSFGWLRFPHAHVQLDVGHPLDKSHSLLGRSTHVFPVHTVVWDEGSTPTTVVPTVAKMQWVEAARTSEAEIIRAAYDVGKGNPFVEGHVTFLYGELVIDIWDTGLLRRRVGAQPSGLRPKESCHRIVRIIWMRLLLPISNLFGPRFMAALWDCFHCHYFLWKGGIHHRDISVGNLMYIEENGWVVGVLNDFDQSSWIKPGETGGPFAHVRTGTMPFMAFELLRPAAISGRVEHIYAYDAQSFFWASAWILTGYERGKLVNDPPFYKKWHNVDQEMCRVYKLAALADPTDLVVQPSHVEYHDWLQRFAMIMTEQKDERDRRARQKIAPLCDAEEYSAIVLALAPPEDVDGLRARGEIDALS